ncbi:MAG: aminotransferase class I/II-fold pyridoxal phosphate-dependent enzyme, partial [Elusimicrobiota bacterium]|nr:aminotransferase class I/II-fold pyridoxal phosphate-dependent enzyme [Elusimicrobiota bacterium]
SIDKKYLDFFGLNLFKSDLTVFPEVDSLHDPVGIIKQAQELYANLVGSKHTFFLLNGSTMGNQAIFLSVCNPGDSIILSRNSHKSAMSGIILGGLWPIWLNPTIDKEFDLFFDSSSHQIEKALFKFPEAKAVFITNPTYNGILTDVKKIADIVHEHGKILIVDEAHGAHLGMSDKISKSAIKLGADIVVQSVHKTLSALSQASVLHVCTDKIDINKVKKVVSLLQTTSPNYTILASIDIARKQMFFNGEELVDKMIENADYIRNKQSEFNKFKFLTRENMISKGYDLDLSKVTINVSKVGIEGQIVSEILAKNYNIQFDCADFFNLIAILGVGTSRQDIDKLIVALKDIEQKTNGVLENSALNLPSLMTEMVMSPRDIFLSSNSEVENIPINEASGYISAQTLTPYPPGIPVLIPGERITKEICEYLGNLDSKAIRVVGQEDKKLEYIKVVKVD